MPQAIYPALPEGNALVALGSNATSRAGGPRATLEAALEALDEGPVTVVARSRFYLSPFVPLGSEPDVVNAVVSCRTDLEPNELMARLHKIERDFDRTRPARWTSRTLDLDLVLVDGTILPDEATLAHWIDLPPGEQRKSAPDRLILPHPRMQDRAFVLVPAAELRPDWRHPLLGLTIREMAAALPEADRAAMAVMAD